MNCFDRVLWMVLLLITGLGLNAFAQSQEKQPDQWVLVEQGTIRQFFSTVGTFRAKQTTKIGPQVSGRVEKIMVDVGTLVKKGQELLKLDTIFFDIEIAQRKADVESTQAMIQSSQQNIKTSEASLEIAKANLDDAKRLLTRMQNLWEKPQGESPSIPQRLYDDAVSKHDQAQANLDAFQSRILEAKARYEQASSGLKQAKEGLRYSETRKKEASILAPYDGIITKRMVDVGESVTSTPITYLLEIQEVSNIYLEFSLPQEKLSQVQSGTYVEFEVEGVLDGKGKGKIDLIFPTIDETTRSFRCRMVIENKDLKFQPGLLAQVYIVEKELFDTLILPRNAAIQGLSGWQAFVKNSKGQPVAKPIEVGLVTEKQVQILGGVQAGEMVQIQTVN